MKYAADDITTFVKMLRGLLRNQDCHSGEILIMEAAGKVVPSEQIIDEVG